MVSEWREVELEAVADEITVGYVGTMLSEYVERGIPFLRSLNVEPFRISTTDIRYITPEFHSRLRKSTLRPGDVVIVRTGKPGTAAVIPNWLAEANCSDLVIIRPGKKLDSRFLAYYINGASQQHVAAHLVGAVQQHFNVASSRKMRIRLPDLLEQRVIAAALGALDDKIELNRQMNQALDAIVQTIFKSWFVDFDPVKAKAEGRKPTGLAPEIAALFPHRFQDSELGQIPEGWNVGSFGKVAINVRRGVSPDELEPDTPYIGLEHMPRRSIALCQWGRSEDLGSNKFEFKSGEILFGKLRPYFHKVGIAPISGVCSTDILVISPMVEDWLGFVIGHVSSVEFVNYTDSSSTGTKMPRTNWGDMARYEIVVPPQILSRAFTGIVRPLFERIQANIHESHTLGEIRDTLLPKLLSGEVRIKDAEKIVEAHL